MGVGQWEGWSRGWDMGGVEWGVGQRKGWSMGRAVSKWEHTVSSFEHVPLCMYIKVTNKTLS